MLTAFDKTQLVDALNVLNSLSIGDARQTPVTITELLTAIYVLQALGK